MRLCYGGSVWEVQLLSVQQAQATIKGKVSPTTSCKKRRVCEIVCFDHAEQL